jgi:uncharacterized membrane protein
LNHSLNPATSSIDRVKPLSPQFKSSLATICHIVGLALALYLSLLKIFALPCIGPGHCQEILYSKYGSVLNVPVGLFGSLLWLGIIVVRNNDKRDLLLVMLALGTGYFMVVQFFVLRGFCLYCTLHAAAAWTAMFLHHERRRLWTPLVAIALAAGGFFLARQHADNVAKADALQAARLAQLPDNVSALPWLGAIHPRSPALVLSLDCPACLDVLDELTRFAFKDRVAGPAVFFKTTETNRVLTEQFVSAVLSQGELSRRDAFLASITVLLADKEKALSEPTAAGERLGAIFSGSAEKQTEARKIIAAQEKALSTVAVGETTPLLITRDGETHSLFKAAHLFP